MRGKGEKSGVLIFYDCLPALEKMPLDDAGALFIAALRYSQFGEVPKLEGSADLVWAMLQASIDRTNDRFEEQKLKSAWGAYKRECAAKNEPFSSFEEWRKTNMGTYAPICPHMGTDASKRNGSESEAEAEEEAEENRRRKRIGGGSLTTPLPPSQGETGFGAELQAAFEDWLAYKGEKRQAYKPTGLKSLVTQIQRQAAQYGEKAVAELIRECMASNWQGIAFDRLGRNTSSRGSGNIFLEMLREGEVERL